MKISRSRLLLVTWGLGLALYFPLSSFYIFDSGLPQPADMIFILLGGCSLLMMRRISKRDFRESFALLAFVGWAVLVTLVWSFLLSDPTILVYPAFLIFNATAFLIVLAGVSTDRKLAMQIIKVVVVLAVFSLLFQFMINFDLNLRRQTLGFNNPNQLGYYALCLSCIVFSLRVCGALGRTLFYGLMICMAFFVSLSFSTTAVVGFAMMAAYVVLRESTTSVTDLAITVVVGLILFYFALDVIVSSEYFTEQALYRVDRLEDKTVDPLQQRGYTRIWEFAQYSILGASEGARYRWGALHSHALHSTFGTILFSYGFVGLALFLTFIFGVARGMGVSGAVIISAPLLYGLTHNGLGQTMFWVMLAVLIGAKRTLMATPRTRPALASYTYGNPV